MKKKKGGGGGGANWMDTYGDMVTLLLCFFVLLYSMSTISDAKWKAIVQSFNPDSIIEDANVAGGNEGPIADPAEGLGSLEDPEKSREQELIEMALQQLFEALQAYMDENGLSQSVEITKGDGYVFISFNDAVFFAGDSAVLLPLGQQVLDEVAHALDNAVDAIDEVRVMGHTAQGDPNRPNRVEVDRTLSANRATNAVIYIQEHSQLSPSRLVSMGYGQWRPVDLNSDEEHRSHNRRVEILITGVDLFNKLGDSIQQYNSLRTGEASFRTEPETVEAAPEGGDVVEEVPAEAAAPAEAGAD